MLVKSARDAIYNSPVHYIAIINSNEDVVYEC